MALPWGPTCGAQRGGPSPPPTLLGRVCEPGLLRTKITSRVCSLLAAGGSSRPLGGQPEEGSLQVLVRELEATCCLERTICVEVGVTRKKQLGEGDRGALIFPGGREGGCWQLWLPAQSRRTCSDVAREEGVLGPRADIRQLYGGTRPRSAWCLGTCGLSGLPHTL